jgi:hypothetical protein
MATVLSNNPPSDVEILLERLADENRDISDRTDELIGGADRCEVSDEESAGKATLLAKMLNETIKTAETRQKAAKLPHMVLANAAFDFFKPTLSELGVAKQSVLTKLDRFRLEQERKAAEERKRLEEEARKRQEEADKIAALATTDDDLDLALEREEAAQDAARAAATLAAPKPIQSAFGHTASARKEWQFKVVDTAKVPREYMSVNEQMIRAAVRGGARSIPGVEIFETTKTVVR